jgi:pimeloyl-ACP methyl ester carboxylesterase
MTPERGGAQMKSPTIGNTARTVAQAPARAHVNWREVILFALLAYGLAWAWSGFFLLPYLGDLLTRSTTPTDMVERLGAVATLPTMLTPMIAALIMRIFVSKEGVKGSLGLLRSPKYYLAALLIPAVFVTAVVLIVQVLGLGEFRWSEANWFVYLMLPVIALPVTLFTFGEEYGWRGYLLPRLLPLGEIRASVLIGVIWGVWHLPLLLAGLNYPGVNIVLAIIVFTFVTVALSFTYTWFYVASSGSVLVVAVFHASTNQFSDTFWVPPLLSGANPFAPSLVSAVLILTLVVVVYGLFRRPVHVNDSERFVHPKLDGTRRDGVRREVSAAERRPSDHRGRRSQREEQMSSSITTQEKGVTLMKTKGSRLWRWTKRVLVGIAGLVLVLLLAGMVFQFVTTKIDESRYPALGEMVDARGYNLHLNCTGEAGGAPTVVMDSGLGGTVLDWQLVQPELAKSMHVCTYDRAGMGWSDPGPQPRTSQQIVKELHTVLGNAGVTEPYVLVGHSFGGTNMQVYASQYPDEVAGMVLIDSALEDEKAVALTQSHQPSPLLMKIYATIGLTRLPYTLGGETSGLTSPELEDEQAAISSHRKHIFAVADENSSLEESFDENRTDPMSLGDKPLMVLTAGSVQLAGTGLSEEQMNLIDELHSESQAALTQRSENAKQIIVADSGHYIHVEQPGLVTDAIHQVVEAARDGSRLSGNET